MELRRTTIQSIKFSEVVQRNIRVHCALCYCPLEEYTVCGRTPFVYVALLGRHVVIHKMKGEGTPKLLEMFKAEIQQSKY